MPDPIVQAVIAPMVVWGWTQAQGWMVLGTAATASQEMARRCSSVRVLPVGRLPAPSAAREWARAQMLQGFGRTA